MKIQDMLNEVRKVTKITNPNYDIVIRKLYL